jgi:tRNA pseudouridine55 synthase
LVVDKPGLDTSGQDPARLLTSHDVVQRVRRWSGQRRIGHTGTLDPFASGVLVLCLGQATRLVEYYQGHAKTYVAEIALGVATDTYDAVGQIVAEAPVPPLDEAAIAAALDVWRGDILQTPPAYSAIKLAGEALYAKARRGETVDIAPRPVTIHRLDLLTWSPRPEGARRLTLRVLCSAGTYVRSLAHDLGRTLGTVAHLARLRREAAGSFTLADSHPLAAIEAAAQRGDLSGLVLPPGTGLALPRLRVDADTARRLGHGQQVASTAPLQGALGPDGLAAIYLAADAGASETALAGIVRCLNSSDSTERLWKAEKWFAFT